MEDIDLKKQLVDCARASVVEVKDLSDPTVEHTGYMDATQFYELRFDDKDETVVVRVTVGELMHAELGGRTPRKER